MTRRVLLGAVFAACTIITAGGLLWGRHNAGAIDTSTDPALTIYNQNFAVVRQTLPLALHEGVNTYRFTETTAHLEPDSVMLRDPAGDRHLQVFEQNYRAEPLSQELLLSMYEGKVLDCQVQRDGHMEVVKGKIIRSGFVPHPSGMRGYGYDYYQTQMAMQVATQPIVEVEGKLQFSLPGQPLFPALSDDAVLKPTLSWLLATNKPGPVNAELSYVTGGMNWQADYNVVAPEHGDVLDLVGWVTMDNESGKTFDHARIRLMAGDVNKLLPGAVAGAVFDAAEVMTKAVNAMQPAVTERSFDEYHLYTLQRPVTLHDRETKQVEFIQASGVATQRLYVYDGAQIDWNRYRGWSFENIRNDHEYGTQSNPKVWVMLEIKNSVANHLGMPLPRGRMRFYRRDEDGRMQFVGENFIDHTPTDETLRLYTGNAFDVVGERRRVEYRIDTSHNTADESFEIRLRNHKNEPLEVRVVEHLYRCNTLEITSKSAGFRKLDSHTVEFPVHIRQNGDATVTYAVHYSW